MGTVVVVLSDANITAPADAIAILFGSVFPEAHRAHRWDAALPPLPAAVAS